LILRKTSRVSKFVCDLLIAGLVLQVFGRRDYGHEHVVAECGLAECHYLYARGDFGQFLEVAADLLVVGELAIRPNFESQELRGCRYSRGLEVLGEGPERQNESSKDTRASD